MSGLTIELLEDDSIKYVQFEGEAEVRFPLQDMDAYAEDLKTKGQREIAQGLAGMSMEIALAFVEDIFPSLQQAIMDHYSIDPPAPELQEEFGKRVAELMPGFCEPVSEEDLEE